MQTVCPDPLHLNHNDKRMLRALRVIGWPCPTCQSTSDDNHDDRVPGST